MIVAVIVETPGKSDKFAFVREQEIETFKSALPQKWCFPMTSFFASNEGKRW
jgi:hypothetical protein